MRAKAPETPVSCHASTDTREFIVTITKYQKHSSHGMGGLVGDLCKAIATLREEGLGKLICDTALSLRVRAQAPFERNFDRQHNVITEGIADLADLTIKGPNKALGSEYVPSPGRLIDHAFSRLPDDLRDYTFVDFGSGKGRVVIRAARRRFRRVVGVEFAKELYELSRKNVDAFTSTRRSHAPIDLLHCDATELSIPDGNCVLFFYNPFRNPVMKRVLRNIETRFIDAPRKLYVIHLALADERGNDADANRVMLQHCDWLTQTMRVPSIANPWIALQFGSFKLDIFESVDRS